VSALSVKLEGRGARIAVTIARVALGALFLWAAVPKLLDPSGFAEAIGNYHLLPAAVVGPLAVAMPVLETVVGLALVSGVEARGGAIVAGLLLVVFAAAMTQAILRGIDLDCGCFGAETRAQVTWWSVGRNAGLTLLSVLVAVAPDTGWRALLAPAPARPAKS